ncbi:hypothetical protein BX666DRAFT_972164 [Dichotomocladium elegans]|nr:hypothetical protein BX666DRAFT_972164 [Dichotomocladium elegans]
MSKRRIPPPPPAASLASYSLGRDNHEAPTAATTPPFAFSSSQLSSSSTIFDPNLHGAHAHNYSSASPVNIPSNDLRMHNNRNRSYGSASDFQSSPRSILMEGSPQTGMPMLGRGSPLPFPSGTDRRATSSTENMNEVMVNRNIASIGPTALSSDYALGVVFAQFSHIADKKMELILHMGIDAEVDFRKLLAVGMDPTFDKLICSLSSLAICQQKQVIDAVMRWRRTTIEPLDPALLRRITESAPLSRARDVPSILKERQSLASVYILCRALIEIVKNFTPETLPEDLGENLEEIVFNQLKRADP